MASTGARSISSIASYSSLATKPMERSAIATMPGSRPGPRMDDQQQRPDQRVDRPRRDDDEQRDRPQQQRARRRVAGRERRRSGPPSARPEAVPSVAMFSVSHNGLPEHRQVRSIAAAPCGHRCRPPASAHPSTKDQIVSRVISCQQNTVRATSAEPARTTPAAACAACATARSPSSSRCAHVIAPTHCAHRRRWLDAYSASITIAMTIARMAAATSNS